MLQLSAIDCKILNCVQEEIPLESEPFKILSKRVGIEESEFIQRVKELKDQGIIRKYAAGLSHRNLGYKGTLIALKIKLDEIDAVAAKLVAFQEITHCYQRVGEFNLYFVLICSTEEKQKIFLEKLAKDVGQENIKNLKTIKQYKLKTDFRIEEFQCM